MFYGPHAGQHRGVAGVRDGGQHTANARSVSPVPHQLPQSWDLETVFIGIENVLRAQAVDRENDRGAARRSLAKSGGQTSDEQNQNKRGKSSFYHALHEYPADVFTI